MEFKFFGRITPHREWFIKIWGCITVDGKWSCFETRYFLVDKKVREINGIISEGGDLIPIGCKDVVNILKNRGLSLKDLLDKVEE